MGGLNPALTPPHILSSRELKVLTIPDSQLSDARGPSESLRISKQDTSQSPSSALVSSRILPGKRHCSVGFLCQATPPGMTYGEGRHRAEEGKDLSLQPQEVDGSYRTQPGSSNYSTHVRNPATDDPCRIEYLPIYLYLSTYISVYLYFSLYLYIYHQLYVPVYICLSVHIYVSYLSICLSI